MLFNNLKLILRQLAGNKTFSGINLVGLITGLTVCFFVAQFVWFEYSFEGFNKNIDRTYRVNLYNTSNGVFEGISSGTVSGLAYDMKQTLPGLDAIGRVSTKVTAVVSNPESGAKNLENRIVYADASAIDILGVTITGGDSNQLYKSIQSIIVAESIALKYFGETDVVGQSLDIGFPGANIEIRSFVIDAVFADLPHNTHQRFDIVLPPANEQQWNENWDWSNVTTYVRLESGFSADKLSTGLASIVKKHHQDNSGDKYLLEPLREIRLHALDGSGRASMVNFFLVLGLIVLVLAWVNYISLSTARFLESMKEVGIRKLIGASRRQLMIRFLTESVVLNVISFCCAIILFALLWPATSSYFRVPPGESLLEMPRAYVLFMVAMVTGVIISGLYPALFLSSFSPLQSIKGKLNRIADRSTLRKILVVAQLAISLVLLTAIFAIERQISFIRSKDPGISLKETLIIDSPLLTDGTTVNKYEPLKNQLIQLSGVSGVTYASSFPGSEIDWHRADIKLNDQEAPHRFSSRIVAIGPEFLDVFDIKLLSGRNFNSEMEGDVKTMLINEEACRMFGFENIADATGNVVFVGSRRFEITGVVKNYHFRSLQHQLQPMLFMLGSPRSPTYAVKISAQRVTETVAAVERLWKATYPDNVFNYYFLDERFSSQYASEQQFGLLTGALTAIALIISFLGLFGLALYSVSRRTKEIGVRKVLGASAWSVMTLLSKEYMKLAAIACIIGVPLIYQLLQRWLERYAYKIPMDLSLFVVPVFILVILTLLSISIKTIGAATAKPVESLRYE